MKARMASQMPSTIRQHTGVHAPGPPSQAGRSSTADELQGEATIDLTQEQAMAAAHAEAEALCAQLSLG